MYPTDESMDGGLDLVLLGTIIAGLGVYAGVISGSAGASPSLVRFFQVSPDTTYSAVLPQDKALLLLTDPRTADAATGGVEPTGSVGLVFVAIGIVLVATGLLVAQSNR